MKKQVRLLTKIGILILGMIIFSTSCEKNAISGEEEILEMPSEEIPLSIESVTFSKDDETLNELRKTYDIDSHIGLQGWSSFYQKSSQGNVGIIVYTDIVKKITKGDYTSYTMLIESLDDDPNTFYNLTVEEIGDSTGMFLTQYKNLYSETSKKENRSFANKTSSLTTSISTKRIDNLVEPVDKEDFGDESGGSSSGSGGGAGSSTTYPTDCDGWVTTTSVVVETCCGHGHNWMDYVNNVCRGSFSIPPIWPSIETIEVYECKPIVDGSSNDGSDGSTGGGGSSGTGDLGTSGDSPNTSLTTPVNQDGSDLADDCNTKKEDLKKIFPNASDADLKTLAHVLNEKAADFGVDTKEELQHFLAQAAHETGGFKNLGSEENLKYTTKSRLLKIFPKYFSETDTIKKRKPDNYINNGSKLANYVYCCRMGNGKESTGDGYKYRGRGIFQLTGKTNYTNFKTWYNAKYKPDKDFVKSPDALKDNDTIAILSALWFYKTSVIDKITVDSTTTVKKVTKKINGGTNGLPDREKHFKKAKDSITCK